MKNIYVNYFSFSNKSVEVMEKKWQLHVHVLEFLSIKYYFNYLVSMWEAVHSNHHHLDILQHQPIQFVSRITGK